jgi:Mn2+/Fe2+ NRAMP family transporter
VLVNALNGLILPLTLGVCLIVARNKRIMGEDYRHPVWLWVLGLIAALASAWVGVTSLGTLADLFK